MGKYRCLAKCICVPFQKLPLLGILEEAIHLSAWFLPNTKRALKNVLYASAGVFSG